ncbi:MAG: CBS domain-containing protein [Saprospiraceae bacterium]|nr:CBS domain-containing protein [Saprospiraceae bacterium]
MKPQVTVPLSKVMLPNLVVLKPTDTLDKASELFKLYPFHHLPVVDDDMILVGMISSTDLERVCYGKSLFKQLNKAAQNEALLRSLMVNEVMVDAVFQLSGKHTIQDAYSAFKKGRFRAIPIVDDGFLIGLITPLDLVRYYVEG